ncbi:Protein kinase domain-containing protein 14 [Elsinoe fawcettii]|nr:Protein kinase domain-containing protein 14 [Elsinoe fawcettii]
MVGQDEPDAQPALIMGAYTSTGTERLSVRPNLSGPSIQLQKLLRCIDNVACISIGNCTFFVRYPDVSTIQEKDKRLDLYRKVCHKAPISWMENTTWTVVRHLGRGMFGSVELVQGDQSGRLLARKKLVKVPDRAGLRREVDCMKALKHENIIKYFMDSEDQGHICLWMQPAHGTLEELAPVSSSPKIFKRMVENVCDALNYLHGQSIMHRDLKPQNILFKVPSVCHPTAMDLRGILKAMPDLGIKFLLTDFGFSKRYDAQYGMSVTGSPSYMAPEILTRNYDEKVDTYAFGAVIYSVADRGRLLDDLIYEKIHRDGRGDSLTRVVHVNHDLLQSRSRRMAKIEPDTVWALIYKMTTLRAEERPSLKLLGAALPLTPLQNFTVSQYREEPSLQSPQSQAAIVMRHDDLGVQAERNHTDGIDTTPNNIVDAQKALTWLFSG